MEFRSLFNMGDIVYVKSVLGKHVTRGIVDGIEFKAYATDFKGQAVTKMFQYRVWVSDHEDNGGSHMSGGAFEANCYPSWEDAWWGRRPADTITAHKL